MMIQNMEEKTNLFYVLLSPTEAGLEPNILTPSPQSVQQCVQLLLPLSSDYLRSVECLTKSGIHT